MNIKKRLEQEAKLTHQKILEESGKNLSSLRERISEQKRRPAARHWRAWLTAACTAAAAVLIICTVFMIPGEKHVVYYEKDLQSSESNIDNLNVELEDFQVDLGENLIVKDIKRTIDGPSGDLLFYEMKLQTADDLVQTSMTVICNRDCDYNPLSQNLILEQTQLPNYTISYYIRSSLNPTFQCQNINACAKIEGANNIIYLTDYKEIAFDEGGTLFEFIQNLVRVKE